MRQERAERTRAALVLSAAAMFDREGYERTTLTGVSRRASVSKGALSFHFSNKAQLADTVQAAGCEASRESLENLRDRGLPALQTLVDMTHLIADQLMRDELVRAGVRLAAERDTDCGSPMHFFGTWYETFQEVAVEAERDGSLLPNHAPRAVATLAISVVSYAHARHRKADAEVRGRVAELWAMLLPSLATSVAGWQFRAEGADEQPGPDAPAGQSVPASPVPAPADPARPGAAAAPSAPAAAASAPAARTGCRTPVGRSAPRRRLREG
ncbi:TetR family transcriptional regulator [Streptomyces sp. XM4193]|uniref:ScbR family autoregulator-binding transcription factor n=1 Tax=Streptomyces sp. XM4193 TaxID=2929782 RepID=UPI001FF8818E|nr:ScbR family autoregulator-binding transcription factor [Streptomyces sp. XM4193]MCK1794600.1 TetR family transcriptional regulator [Streptomyces sp. XM4193]